MSSTFFKVGALVLLPMLVTGCLTVPTGPIRPTQTAEIDQAVTQGVCGVWKAVTYSSRDTEQTQLEARANNAARDAYCR